MAIGLRNTFAVMFIVTKICWDFYTDQVKNNESPRDALKYNIRMAQSWQSEKSLKDMPKYALQTPSSLATCFFGKLSAREEIRQAELLHGACWNILAERCWSLAARHEGPPESYADFFAPREGAMQQCFEHKIMRDANAVYKLESRKLQCQTAEALWKDLHGAHSQVVRLLWAFFERDGAMSAAGYRLLRGCVLTWADAKAVEELHHHCKMDVKCRQNKKQPGHHLQHIVTQSNVIG